jgi:hypothetical protein
VFLPRLRPPSKMTPSMPVPSRRIDVLVACGVGALTLAVYLRSLLPGIGYAGDTAKWQFLGRVGGVPHPTGYPLYLALDKAWVTLVPWGSLAWRVNLLSAVLGAAAVGVLYALLRILDVRREVAAATALVFAFSQTFWTQAVVAEVYTLHILFLVTVTACLAHWRKGAPNAWLLAGLGLYALSFGHHLTTGLALPGIAWLVWSDRKRALTARNVAFVAGALVVSATQYLYLLHLSDVGRYHEARIDDFGDVLGYVTGGRFKDSMFNYSWYGLLVARVPLWFRFLRTEFFLLLVPMAYGIYQGLRATDRAQRAVAVHLLSLAVFTSIYVMNFDVPDVIVFFLPLFLAAAVFLGLALEAAVAGALRRWPDDHRVPQGVAVGLVALVAVVALVDYQRASQRGTVRDAHRIERALATVDDGSVLITDDYHDSEFFWYYLLGEDLGDEHDLALAHLVKPAQVEQYFTRRTGPVAVAALEVDRSDPALYTASAHQAVTLAARGLTVTEVAEDVWRIGPDPTETSTQVAP